MVGRADGPCIDGLSLCFRPVWCISLEGQATFMDILWNRTCATGWFYDFEFGAFGYLVRRMGSGPLGVGGTVSSNVTIDNTEAQYNRSTTYRQPGL